MWEEESRIAERDVARKKMTREEKMKVKGLKKNRLKKDDRTGHDDRELRDGEKTGGK